MPNMAAVGHLPERYHGLVDIFLRLTTQFSEPVFFQTYNVQPRKIGRSRGHNGDSEVENVALS